MAPGRRGTPVPARAPLLPPLALAALCVLCHLPLAGGVWELEQLWEEDVREYVQVFTGDLDDNGVAIDTKFLRYEDLGWYQRLYDRTSVGMHKGADTIDTGLGQGLTLVRFRAQLEDLRDTSLTLQLNLSTLGTHPRVNLDHIGDKESLS
jgi:hypothetical protein